jgi:hypothetical protein
VAKQHLKSVGINTKRLSRNAQQKVSREAGWTLKSSAASVLATVSCTSAILNGEQLPRNPLRQIHQKVQELFNQKYLP